MEPLNPAQAAEIAGGVYALREHSVVQATADGQTLGCEGLFDVGTAARFEGRSGALAWKPLSGFGYIAEGVGRFAGDVLIATRGTQGKKWEADWISNYNIAMQLGPGGLPVHAGFNEVWKSFRSDIADFLSQRQRPPRLLHCVGHSLGGALATLTADHVSRQKQCAVALYTFGAPRVGDALFARSLTGRIDKDLFYRVYHPSDPVPMIPLFPFFHMPFGGAGIAVENKLGGLINSDAHAMEDSYARAVGQSSWDTLRRGAAARADQAAQVKGWLEQSAQGSGSFVMGSARLLDMIGRALAWMAAQAGKLVVAGLSIAVVNTFTTLDQLAWLLTQAAHLQQEMRAHLRILIGAILGFLGRKVAQVGEVTAAFLRWLLTLLFTSLRNAAQRAANRLRGAR